jgi:hypothetical protein
VELWLYPAVVPSELWAYPFVNQNSISVYWEYYDPDKSSLLLLDEDWLSPNDSGIDRIVVDRFSGYFSIVVSAVVSPESPCHNQHSFVVSFLVGDFLDGNLNLLDSVPFVSCFHFCPFEVFSFSSYCFYQNG